MTLAIPQPSLTPAALGAGVGPNFPVVLIPSADRIGRALDNVQLLISLVAGVAALVTGLVLIYAPDASWGGLVDVGLLVLAGLLIVPYSRLPSGE